MKRPGGFDRRPDREAAEAALRAEAERAERAAAEERAAELAAEREAAERDAAARAAAARAERDRAEHRRAAAAAADRAATGPASEATRTGLTGGADADLSETVDLGDLDELSELSDAEDAGGAAAGSRAGSGGTGGSALVPASSSGSGSSGVGGVLRRFVPGRADPDPVRDAERRVRAAERQTKRRTRHETKRFTAAIRRTRRRTLIAIGTVLALVLFVLLGAFTPLMSVREVKIEGAEHVGAEEVGAALARFDGVPLALVDENEVLRALEGFPLIQRFAVERVPPHTLVVRIEERVPVIAISDGDGVKLYDAAGVLVGEAPERPEGVPLGGNGLRGTSSKAFATASRIVRDMPPELRAQAVSVEAQTGQDVTFVLANGIEVFWGNADETKRKSLVLQTMLASLEGREVSHIDVSSTEAPIFR